MDSTNWGWAGESAADYIYSIKLIDFDLASPVETFWIRSYDITINVEVSLSLEQRSLNISIFFHAQSTAA